MSNEPTNPNRRNVAALLFGAMGASVLQACVTSGSDTPILGHAEQPLVGGGAVLVMASSIGIHTSNNSSQNEAGFLRWLSNDSGAETWNNSTLVFDEVGTYLFPADTIVVPNKRTLNGINGAVLQCDGDDGDVFIANQIGAGEIYIDNLTIDGNSKVNYVIAVEGSVSWTDAGDAAPPIYHAAATTRLSALYVSNGKNACIRGYGTLFVLKDIITNGGPIGFQMEGCSESVGMNLSGINHTAAAFQILGSLGGERPNGGRMSLYRIGSSAADPIATDIGLEIDGVAQCDVFGATFEGIDTVAVKIHNGSQNVHVFGLRSNSGNSVVFDACLGSNVYGGCNPAQNVVYSGGAKGCRAFMVAESSGTFDITQEWTDGTTTWQGRVRSDGTVHTNDGGPPTVGAWLEGDMVWNDDYNDGLAVGWRYSGTDWVEFPETPGYLKETSGGSKSASGLRVLGIIGALYNLSGGYDGQTITVLAEGDDLWLSDLSAGNLWLSGGSGPHTAKWAMMTGDTATFVRITHATHGVVWREVARTDG